MLFLLGASLRLQSTTRLRGDHLKPQRWHIVPLEVSFCSLRGVILQSIGLVILFEFLFFITCEGGGLERQWRIFSRQGPSTLIYIFKRIPSCVLDIHDSAVLHCRPYYRVHTTLDSNKNNTPTY